MGFYDPEYTARMRRAKKQGRKYAKRRAQSIENRKTNGVPVQRVEKQEIHGQTVTVKVLPTMHAYGGWPGSMTKSWRQMKNLSRCNASNVTTRGQERTNTNIREKQRDNRADSVSAGEEAQRKAAFIVRRKAKPPDVGV
jgi:hypothetical protein